MRAKYLRVLNKTKELAHQPWDYLLGMIAICVLSLFLVMNIFFKIYSVFLLNENTKGETSKASIVTGNARPAFISTSLNVNQTSLFGIPQPKFTAPAPSNFALLGIDFHDGNPSKAKAIISINSGEAEVYKVGDSIQEGTVISKITANKVYLSHNGITQVLELAWEKIPGHGAERGGS